MLAALFYASHMHAQQFPISDTVGQAYAEALSKSYASKNEAFLELLKEEVDDKKKFRFYESRYKRLFAALNEQIKDGYMVEVPAAAAIVNKIVDEIKANNSIVPQDVQVLLVRNNLPNAYTIGDNVLFVNTGLFYYMQSEDQIACVLAHEIGHLILRHSFKAVSSNYEDHIKSEETVRRIKEHEANRHDRAMEQLKKLIYEGGELTRMHEMQADSICVALIKNTKYQPYALIQVLDIMDKNDTITYDDLNEETYRLMFDVPQQEFNADWLATEDFSSYNYDAYKSKFNEDSVSSHPKAEERIRQLKNTFPELVEQKTDTDSVNHLGSLNSLAEQMRVENLYYNERYGEALYLSLLYLQDDPENKLYLNWLNVNLNKLYEARKSYELNKYMDRVAPNEQTKSYIRFLNFMWNLKLEELEVIAKHYSTKT